MSGEPLHSAIVVAHPDDETLWAGGLMLMNSQRRWTIAALCRAGDPDRAPRFAGAAAAYGADHLMADLDDGPEQAPLDPSKVRDTIRELLAGRECHALVTHSPWGEYTRHRRHEDVGRAVLELWEERSLRIHQLWVFAYEDGASSYLPRAIAEAHWKLTLPEEIWQKKRSIVMNVYGFTQDSYEARTTPRTEAFWLFTAPAQMRQWMESKQA